jgi:hypothetical protein
MSKSGIVRLAVVMLCLSLVAPLAFAQTPPLTQEYTPREGQSGKDVIWLPTSQSLVEMMLDVAKVTAQDYVIDLGSGDGRLVITAAKRGAQALGIEYDAGLVEVSKRNATREGVSDRAQFVKADLFESDFSKATVITMFLMPDINLKLRPRILDLKPGTRIVSNTFTMGEWEADQTVKVPEGKDCSIYCTGLLWIVPAKVEGTWKLAQGELAINQSFQMISGTLKSGSNSTPIKDGRLTGNQVSFNVGEAQYTGSVSGKTMQGTVISGGKTEKWSATWISEAIPGVTVAK